MNKKICNILFCSALFLFTFEYFFGIIPLVAKYKFILSILQYLLLGICFIKQSVSYSSKELIKILLALSVTLGSYLVTKESSFLILVLFLIVSRNIEVEKVIGFDFKMKLFMLFLLALFLFTGTMTNTVVYRLDGTIRNTFGFNSPNTIGLIIMTMCLEYVYLHKKNVNFKIYFIIIFFALLNLFFTDSRASSISMICFVLLLVFYNKTKHLSKFVPFIMPFFLVSCFVLIILYGKGNIVALRIDQIVTTRIKIGYNFYNLYGIHIMGNNIPNVTTWNGYVNYLDSAYLNLLINHGLLISLLFTTYFVFMMKKLVYHGKKIEIAILITLLIYGLFERSSFLIIYNIFLLLGKEEIYEKKM